MEPRQIERRSDRARHLRDLLRLEIVSGSYHGGDLPTEGEFMLMFGATRNAVRLALDLLRADGLVERVPGSGTHVISAKAINRHDQLLGLAEQHDYRDRVAVRTIGVRAMPAPRVVADRLAVDVGDTVIFYERRLWLDKAPLSLWSSYLPAERAGGLLGIDTDVDFYYLAEHELGIELGSCEFVTEAVAVDGGVGDLLDLPAGAAVLRLERVTRERSGQPFELGFAWLRGDRIQFVSHLERPWLGAER